MNAPATFSAVWAVVSQLLDANATIKVSINSGDQNALLSELIADEQLEERYGGKAPNKTENFWPPNNPSQEFKAMLENEQINSHSEPDGQIEFFEA